MIWRDATLRAKPRYVERGGDIVYRHPFTAHRARIFHFLIQADLRALQNLLDQSFSDPTAKTVEYVPLGPYVSLNFVSTERLGSEAPDDRLAAVSEREVGIWIPCRRRNGGSVVWFVPYMFVDSATALASGREVFGYPKQLGDFVVEGPEAQPTSLTLSTLACRTFGPTATACTEPVLTIRQPAPSGPSVTPIGELDDALASLADLAVDEEAGNERDSLVEAVVDADLVDVLTDPFDVARTAAALIRDIQDNVLTMVFLKQFRSCEDPEAACYQAIVEVPHTLRRVGSFAFLPRGCEVAFEVLDSEPIVRDLGLASATATPRLSFTMELDFTVRPGRVLWQAT